METIESDEAERRGVGCAFIARDLICGSYVNVLGHLVLSVPRLGGEILWVWFVIYSVVGPSVEWRGFMWSRLPGGKVYLVEKGPGKRSAAGAKGGRYTFLQASGVWSQGLVAEKKLESRNCERQYHVNQFSSQNNNV